MNCHNRLIVLGAKSTVKRLIRSDWERTIGARYSDWLQNSPGRYVCHFETEARPFQQLTKLSRLWPTLTFLLDYELERKRTKGLAKAKSGEIEHCEIRY
ncbi:MAG: hypothetical protein ACXWC8_03900 [Limisphaerales bacterium]